MPGLRVRLVPVLLALLWASAAPARVLNVEFKFTPFVGDTKDDHVDTVAGQARVFVNDVPIAEQPVEKHEVPVLFEAREVAPSVWLPVDSLGSLVRKGKNTFRVEFEPTDAKVAYRAQLRWATVTDQARESDDGGHHTATNQSDEGVDEKKATGKVVMEHQFEADFAADQPWHHYPPVTALAEDDKERLKALVKQRVDAFKPDFAGVYALLEGNPRVDLAKLRPAKCLDKAWAAGVRIIASPPEQIEVVTTGGPAVVVGGKTAGLYAPLDSSAFEKIKGDEAQMCVSMVLFAAYPPRLIVVHAPTGGWEVVH